MAGVLLGLCRLALGALFLVAAVGKVGDLSQFAEEVANYQLLPGSWVPFVAAALPGVELLAGTLLVAGLWARPAASVIAFLLALFIAGLTQAFLRGIDLRCGCFGGGDLATWATVARDAVLLLPALLIARLGPGRLAVRPCCPAAATSRAE